MSMPSRFRASPPRTRNGAHCHDLERIPRRSRKPCASGMSPLGHSCLLRGLTLRALRCHAARGIRCHRRAARCRSQPGYRLLPANCSSDSTDERLRRSTGRHTSRSARFVQNHRVCFELAGPRLQAPLADGERAGAACNGQGAHYLVGGNALGCVEHSQLALATWLFSRSNLGVKIARRWAIFWSQRAHGPTGG